MARQKAKRNEFLTLAVISTLIIIGVFAAGRFLPQSEDGSVGQAWRRVARTTPSCSDSDGGLKYTAKGTASAGGKSASDRCISDAKLREYYCKGNSIKSTTYSCSGGKVCSAGACVKKKFHCGYYRSSSSSSKPRAYNCNGWCWIETTSGSENGYGATPAKGYGSGMLLSASAGCGSGYVCGNCPGGTLTCPTGSYCDSAHVPSKSRDCYCG